MDPVVARRNLEAELARLDALGRGGPLEPTGHGDVGDEGAALYEREVEQALDSELRAERSEVRAALARVEAGSYGRCEGCGAAIPDARLEAVPATRYCRNHEDAAELHLGARPGVDHRDPAEVARREAQAHLDLLADDDIEDDGVGAEEQAVHVQRP